MIWWVTISAVVAAALAYGYWEHRRESRRLAKLFAHFAREFDGSLKAANFFALPQLRFERNERRYLMTAMANSGTIGPVRGPFTLVDLDLPFDSGQRLKIVQSRGPDRAIGRVIDSVTPGQDPTTGHRAFDEAFHIVGGDHAFAAQVLDPDMRAKLLGVELPRLEIYLDARRIKVSIDGFAERQAELAAMIDIADLLADRCPVAA